MNTIAGAKIEVISGAEIDQAWERRLSSNVRYGFVIDTPHVMIPAVRAVEPQRPAARSGCDQCTASRTGSGPSRSDAARARAEEMVKPAVMSAPWLPWTPSG